MSFTQQLHGPALPTETLSLSDCRQMLEAMAENSGSRVLLLESPTDDPVAARLLWANFDGAPDFWQQLVSGWESFPPHWEALKQGETVRRESLLSEDSGQTLFQAMLIPLDVLSTTIRFGLILENHTDQEQARQESRDLMTRAHCLLWHAQVTLIEDQLEWHFDISNLAAALQWLPIRHLDSDPLIYSWSAARPLEETARMDETSRTAILSGAANYAQEFSVRLTDGQIRHLAETVQIESCGPSCWNLTGVCTDATERHRAEAEARDIMAGARCLIWHADIVDVDGEAIWDLQFSDTDAALQWLPIHRPEGMPLGWAWAMARPPEEAERANLVGETALRSGLPGYDQEFHVVLENGTTRLIHETVQIKLLEPGHWHAVGVCTDATERREAQDELRNLMTRAHCLLWYADVEDRDGQLHWKFQYSHLEAALEWLPIYHPAGQSFDWSWVQARLPEDTVRVNLIGENALRTGQPSYQHEARVRLQNGEVRQIMETVQIEPVAPGRWRLTGVCTDATERHEVEDELRKLLTNVRCLIWHADVEGNPSDSLKWNLRISNEEAVQGWLPILLEPGQSFLRAWEVARLPEDQAVCDKTCMKALQAGSPRFNQEFRVRLADGQIRWLAEDVQIETLGPNRWHFVGVCTDITERKAEQETLSGVITRARCLVWHATVLEQKGELDWDLQIPNSESVARWLAIQPKPGQSFPLAWYESRFPEDDEACDQLSKSALRDGASGYRQEFRCRESSGHVRWLAEDVHIESQGPGRWHLVGICTDITERKAEQEALRDVVTHARCLVWRAEVAKDGENMAWEMQVFNEEAAQRWLEIPILPDQVFVDAWIGARIPEDIQHGDDVYLIALREGKPSYSQEYRCRTTDGGVRWLAEDVQIEVMGEGRWRLFGVCTDITERKALEEEREQILAQALEQADRDPLTGLLNHRAFHAYLAREADRAERGGSVLGIAVIDLDNFKFFNDAYGHLSGDDVLRQVASALQDVCRSYDTLARFGGDEFAVLMPGAGPSDVAHLAERLASCLEKVRYRPPGASSDIPLSLSVGMAVFPHEASAPLAALHLADERLLRVKSGDRGTGAQAEQLRAFLTNGVEGFSMLDALVVAVDNKDRYTRSHSEGVLFYCLQIAEALELEAEAIHQIQVAALLHDVGKIGIPDHILRKPGKLTEAEFGAMKQHPVMGAAIVAAVPGLEWTLPAVRHHHERWDGRGYPDGLTGEDTPLEARIMAVADAFSAMTTDRPYRKGMSPEEARAVLEVGAGTQWDPRCVQAFLTAQRSMACHKANVPILISQYL